MFIDTLAIFYRLHILHYYDKVEAHPELNSDKFAEKMSTLYFAIVLLIVAILILLFWYDTEHFEIWIFPGR